MTTLYILVDESTGKKFVMWKIRDEAEDMIGDGMQEISKGDSFFGTPWGDLKTGQTFEVEDENEPKDPEVRRLPMSPLAR